MKLKTKVVQDPAADPTTAEEQVAIKENRTGTLSEKMVELLIRQLKHELYNHNLYRTFANYFGVKGFAVLEKYYIERAEEEKHHHDWIINYLGETDSNVKYPAIPEIEEEWDDMVKPFQITVDAEIKTTQMIYEMVDQASQEKDWGTYMWLLSENDDWGMLVKEQVEEESTSRTALDIAEGEGSWYRKEKSIYDMYKKDLD